jgi:hypothetical protein
VTQYDGLDVSLKQTKLQVLDEVGKRVWRGRRATEPAAITTAVRQYAPTAVRHLARAGWCREVSIKDRRATLAKVLLGALPVAEHVAPLGPDAMEVFGRRYCAGS